MSADFQTDLGRRLAELEQTTSRVHLRDPAAVRRRGRQRARRQTAGAVAATLAVVGLGVAGVSGLLDRQAVPEPAGPVPTTTVAPSPQPSWSWSPEQPVEGTLPASALPAVGPYGDAEPWTEADAESISEQITGRTACGDAAPADSSRASTTAAAASLDAALRQRVLAYDNADAARAAYDAWLAACAGTVVTTPVAGGPSVAASGAPVDLEYDGSLSSAVWLGTNVVVVVDVVGNIGPDDLADLDDGVAQTAEQLASSVERVMGGGA